MQVWVGLTKPYFRRSGFAITMADFRFSEVKCQCFFSFIDKMNVTWRKFVNENIRRKIKEVVSCKRTWQQNNLGKGTDRYVLKKELNLDQPCLILPSNKVHVGIIFYHCLLLGQI